jgi:hypothetical protein
VRRDIARRSELTCRGMGVGGQPGPELGTSRMVVSRQDEVHNRAA